MTDSRVVVADREIDAVGVVVLGVVGHEAFELACVPDDGAVKELVAHGSDPAFRERVGHGGLGVQEL